jgi:hypothetical protein
LPDFEDDLEQIFWVFLLLAALSPLLAIGAGAAIFYLFG